MDDRELDDDACREKLNCVGEVKFGMERIRRDFPVTEEALPMIDAQITEASDEITKKETELRRSGVVLKTSNRRTSTPNQEIAAAPLSEPRRSTDESSPHDLGRTIDKKLLRLLVIRRKLYHLKQMEHQKQDLDQTREVYGLGVDPTMYVELTRKYDRILSAYDECLVESDNFPSMASEQILKGLQRNLSAILQRAQLLKFGAAGRRKMDILREDPDDGLTVSGSQIPDPGKSALCDQCDTYMNSFHSHPWTDPVRVHSHFTSKKGNGPSPPDGFDWRAISVSDLLPLAEPLSVEVMPRERRRIIPLDCELCDMVKQILTVNKQEVPTQFLKQELWYYRLKPTLYGVEHDLAPKRHIGQNAPTEFTPHNRWCLGIDIKCPGRRGTEFELSNVIHFASRPLPRPGAVERSRNTPYEQRSIVTARLAALQCPVELLRHWLQLCDRCHEQKCTPRQTQGVEIRLIDTEHNCIVSIEPSDPLPTYAALSYVWGDKQQPYAPTKEEYDALYEERAMDRLKLARTVSDAMLLTQKMGLRYLWVDALCIQQHNSIDKHNQIRHMSSVYQNASLTIVAASGVDCDAGLPGLQHGTRSGEQQTIQAGDLALVSSTQFPGNRILTPHTSKWAQRGWTFQENMLSARQLIFTDKQVWWRCSRAVWCEHSLLESDDPVAFSFVGQPHTPRLEDRYRKLSAGEYFELVGNYAQRQLSYSSDALHAFSGILSALTECSGERFVWGFMRRDFERQLYWTGEARLRSNIQDNEFPSWSWVAWEGSVSFSHHQYYRPLVECWSICGGGGDDSDDDPRLVKLGETTEEEDQTTLSQPIINIDTLIETHLLDLIHPTFHLLFYTYSATFYLIPQGRLILPDLNPRFNYSPDGSVLLGPKPDYGYLVPSLRESELCDKGPRECILLGRKDPASNCDVPHVVVMLVSRGKNGVCRRLAIADMPEEFWNLAEKTYELVVLG